MTTPSHIGIIPDGNRRYSKKSGITVEEAYNQGVQKLFDVLDWSKEKGIQTLSVYGFSMENFKRPIYERKLLFKMFEHQIKDFLKRNRNLKISFVGAKHRFPSKIMSLMDQLEKKTKSHKEQELNIAVGYTGIYDIVEACRNMLNSSIKTVNEKTLRSYLKSSSVSNIDLVIRTSGEIRTSGFFPCQTAYSEFVFLKHLWPEFTKKDFSFAVSQYSQRHRRFGQ